MDSGPFPPMYTLVHSSPRVDFGEENFPSLNIFQNVSLHEFLFLKKINSLGEVYKYRETAQIMIM